MSDAFFPVTDPVRTAQRTRRDLLMRMLVAGLAGALIAAATLVLGVRQHPTLLLDMDREYVGTLSGVFPPERDGDVGFAWTSDRARLALPGLDRRVPWTCRWRLRAARPSGVQMPAISVAVDGVTVKTVDAVDNAFRDTDVALAAASDRAGAQVALLVAPAWSPGGGDPRSLGVQLDRISCEPHGTPAVPVRAWRDVALAAAIFGVAVALTGLGGLATLLVTGLTAAALGTLAAFGTAPYTASTAHTLWVVAWTSLALALSTMGARQVRGRPLTRESAGAIAVVASSALLMLLGLMHPAKPLVDAVFHAHRFEWVQAGRYFFAQTMPDGVLFPYAIALYVAALPFETLIRDHVLLLRVVVLVAHALSSLLVYAMIARAWRDRLAAVWAVALYQTMPLAFIVVGNANLTNAFGRSTALAAMAAATLLSLARRRGAVEAMGLTMCISVGLLSHISVLPLLTASLLAMAAWLLLFGFRGERGPAMWIATGTVAAIALSVAVYYGHFGDVFSTITRVRSRSTVSAPAQPLSGSVATAGSRGVERHDAPVRRAGAGEASESPAAAAAAPAQAAQPAPRGAITSALPGRMWLALDISRRAVGWPVFLAALAGAACWWRRGMRDRLGAALIGWIAALTVSVILVMSAPVDARFQRYAVEFLDRVNYTVSPLYAVLAGLGCASAWRSGLIARLAAVVLSSVALCVGVRAFATAYFG